MTHWTALPLAAALLLCAGLTQAALAASPWMQRPAAPAPSQAAALVVAHDYFTTLSAGMHSGDFSALEMVYDERAALLLRTPFALSRNPASTAVIHGRASIERAYQSLRPALLGWRWSPLRVIATSRTHVRSYQYAWNDVGVGLTSITHFIALNGKIQQLVWTIHYGT